MTCNIPKGGGRVLEIPSRSNARTDAKAVNRRSWTLSTLQCLFDLCPLRDIHRRAPRVGEPLAFGQISPILTRPQFKAFLFGDIPAERDDQIPACVIFSSQSHARWPTRSATLR
jgi:hypothetical protein